MNLHQVFSERRVNPLFALIPIMSVIVCSSWILIGVISEKRVSMDSPCLASSTSGLFARSTLHHKIVYLLESQNRVYRKIKSCCIIYTVSNRTGDNEIVWLSSPPIVQLYIRRMNYFTKFSQRDSFRNFYYSYILINIVNIWFAISNRKVFISAIRISPF